MSTQKTERPVCDCHGTYHFEGSYGCIHRVTEEELRSAAAGLASLIRAAAVVNRAMERRRKLKIFMGVLCALAALILAWWEITK